MMAATVKVGLFVSDEIRAVRVLRGHLSPETAYVVGQDSAASAPGVPVRHWIETAPGGPQQGKRRFISQVGRPKRPADPWNPPQRGTYEFLTWMFLTSDGQVGHVGIGEAGVTPCLHALLGLLDIADQMTPDEEDGYDLMLQVSQLDQRSWREWHRQTDAIAEHLCLTGRPPVVRSQSVTLVTGQRFAMGQRGLAIRLAVARERLPVLV